MIIPTTQKNFSILKIITSINPMNESSIARSEFRMARQQKKEMIVNSINSIS
jgi:hypothetical protein